MTGPAGPPADDQTERRRRRTTEAGLLVLVLIWGLNFAVVKWSLEAFTPLGFNALRHVGASLFMLLLLASRDGIGRPDRADIGRILWLGVVGIFVYQLAFIFGLDRTRAGNASLMLALVPLFLLILGRSADRRPMSWVGALLTVAGVSLVSGSSLRMEGSGTLVGDAILIGAAALWAVYTLGSKPLIARYGPIRATAWTLCVGSAGLLIIGIPSLVAQDWSRVTAAAWGGVLFSSLLSIGVAYLLWYRGVQILGGARTAVFSNLTPVVALGAGALWLGESLTLFSALGAAMVISGVLLVRTE